jgi:hypothetical protein
VLLARMNKMEMADSDAASTQLAPKALTVTVQVDTLFALTLE